MSSNCVICLKPLGTEGVSAVQFGHKYHSPCLENWFIKSNSCSHCGNQETENMVCPLYFTDVLDEILMISANRFPTSNDEALTPLDEEFQRTNNFLENILEELCLLRRGPNYPLTRVKSFSNHLQKPVRNSEEIPCTLNQGPSLTHFTSKGRNGRNLVAQCANNVLPVPNINLFNDSVNVEKYQSSFNSQADGADARLSPHSTKQSENRHQFFTTYSSNTSYALVAIKIASRKENVVFCDEQTIKHNNPLVFNSSPVQSVKTNRCMENGQKHLTNLETQSSLSSLSTTSSSLSEITTGCSDYIHGFNEVSRSEDSNTSSPKSSYQWSDSPASKTYLQRQSKVRATAKFNYNDTSVDTDVLLERHRRTGSFWRSLVNKSQTRPCLYKQSYTTGNCTPVQSNVSSAEANPKQTDEMRVKSRRFFEKSRKQEIPSEKLPGDKDDLFQINQNTSQQLSGNQLQQPGYVVLVTGGRCSFPQQLSSLSQSSQPRADNNSSGFDSMLWLLAGIVVLIYLILTFAPGKRRDKPRPDLIRRNRQPYSRFTLATRR